MDLESKINEKVLALGFADFPSYMAVRLDDPLEKIAKELDINFSVFQKWHEKYIREKQNKLAKEV